MAAGVALQGQAAPPVEIPVLSTQEVLGDSIWNQLSNYYYQTLFNHLGDINTNLASVDGFNIRLQEGRVLLVQDAAHTMLADHFGLTLTTDIPVGGLLNFGGDVGAYLLRLRQIPSPTLAPLQPLLGDDLGDWNPKAKLANTATFQQNINPWIDGVISEVKSGKMDTAASMFPGIPQEQYLDLLAGLKLPFEMPWTAKRVLDSTKFKLGDLASFIAQGGVFARIGGMNIAGLGTPWAGLFLNGQFRFGLLKINPTTCYLRIDTMRQEGAQYSFKSKFDIQILSGAVFGQPFDPKVKISPINISGQSYDSQLFARTYKLDFSQSGVRDAYDAALHGNLTVLDDLSAETGSGAEVISGRYDDGHYNQNQVNIHFGPVNLNNSYSSSNVEEQFWDERGTFDYFTANASRASYTDVNLLIWNVRQTRTNSITAQAYKAAPGGAYPPRMSWKLDEVNFHASDSDRAQMSAFLKSLEPALPQMKHSLSTSSQYHAGFQIQVHPQGVLEFQKHSANDVWKSAGQILYQNPNIWKDEATRQAWLATQVDQSGTDLNPDLDNYNQVAQWAQALTKPPLSGDYKAWFSRLLNWQRSSYWDALGVQLFLSLISRENRYLELDLNSSDGKANLSYTDGTTDTSAYPNDWEYLDIPPIPL